MHPVGHACTPVVGGCQGTPTIVQAYVGLSRGHVVGCKIYFLIRSLGLGCWLSSWFVHPGAAGFTSRSFPTRSSRLVSQVVWLIGCSCRWFIIPCFGAGMTPLPNRHRPSLFYRHVSRGVCIFQPSLDQMVRLFSLLAKWKT